MCYAYIAEKKELHTQKSNMPPSCLKQKLQNNIRFLTLQKKTMQKVQQGLCYFSAPSSHQAAHNFFNNSTVSAHNTQSQYLTVDCQVRITDQECSHICRISWYHHKNIVDSIFKLN